MFYPLKQYPQQDRTLFTNQRRNKQNYEDDIIDQIQNYAQQIFSTSIDMTSASRYEQQMSLQLSNTASDIDLNQIQGQNKEGIGEFESQFQNPFRENKNWDKNYHTQQLDHSKNIDQMTPIKPSQYGRFNLLEQSSSRFKENFSNNNRMKQEDQTLLQQKSVKNLQGSKLEHLDFMINDVKTQNKDYNWHRHLSPSINEKSRKRNKSINYASNYVSPYSSRGIRSQPKGYMQKSNNQLKCNQNKETKQMQFIRNKINQNVEPHLSFKKQLASKKANPHRFSHVKSKYRQTKPILSDYQNYAEENIYKKVKTEMGVLEEKKRIYSKIKPQRIEENWNQFILREQQFYERKKHKILEKQLQNLQRETSKCKSPHQDRVLRQTKLNVMPPQNNAQNYVKKIKRQKQKLKEKLQLNEISNFVQRSYEDQKRFGPAVFKNIWSQGFQKSDYNNSSVVGNFSTIKQSLVKNQLSVSFSKDDQNNNLLSRQKVQKFLRSVDMQQKTCEISKSMVINSQYSSRNRKKYGNLDQSQKKNNSFNRSKRKQQNVSLLKVREEKPDRHFFKIQVGKMPSGNKKNMKEENQAKLKYLPKYFHSIDQLDEYSSQQKKQQKQKTYELNSPKSRNSNVSKPLGSINQVRRDTISCFDRNQMLKTIREIEKLQISHEKKRIQNRERRKNKLQKDYFSNISNLMPEQRNRMTRNLGVQQRNNSYSRERGASYSVSPIPKDDSIGLSLSQINESKNSISRGSRNSSLVVMKNTKEIQFILGDAVNEQEKSFIKHFQKPVHHQGFQEQEYQIGQQHPLPITQTLRRDTYH